MCGSVKPFLDAQINLIWQNLWAYVYFSSYSAGRTTLAKRCTSSVSSTSLPRSAVLSSLTTPESAFVLSNGLHLSFLITVLFWMEQSLLFFLSSEATAVGLKAQLCKVGRAYGAPKQTISPCLSGCCRRGTPHPVWPGCQANNASWFLSTCLIWYTVRPCPGWESTTALCCLW